MYCAEEKKTKKKNKNDFCYQTKSNVDKVEKNNNKKTEIFILEISKFVSRIVLF